LVEIIVGFALCFQRIKDTNLTLDSHLFLPLFLGRTHVIFTTTRTPILIHVEKLCKGQSFKDVEGQMQMLA